MPLRIFSLYDIGMTVKATEHQIDAWVSEAEAGYDVEALKKRGRGRPGRGAQPSQVIAVRLTAEELKMLDQLAAEKHLSRSELMRQAITSMTAA